MNERIKELMGKTLDDKFSHTWDTMTHEGLLMFSEKFAELIVRECTEVIFETSVEYIEIDAMHRIRDNVKSHFGVE